METRQKVIELRKKSPCATEQAIGDVVGLTRERVRQILKSEGLSTKHYIMQYICNTCRKTFTPLQSMQYSKMFCSKECRTEKKNELGFVTVICETCKNPIQRRFSDFKKHTLRNGKLYFCGKKCQGVWLGNNYGAGRPKLNKEEVSAKI